jgi:predicted HTH domain antitoxin
MKKYFYILLIIFGFSSCSEYQKAIKSEDPTVKFDQASKLYEKGKLSLGQAAEFVGLSKPTFAEMLGKYDVSLFNYPASDISQDVKNA